MLLLDEIRGKILTQFLKNENVNFFLLPVKYLQGNLKKQNCTVSNRYSFLYFYLKS